MPLRFKTVRHLGLLVLTLIIILVAVIPAFMVHVAEKPVNDFNAEMREAQIINTLYYSLIVSRDYIDKVLKGEATFSATHATFDKDLELIDDLGELVKGEYVESKIFNELKRQIQRFKTASLNYLEEYIYDPAGSATKEMSRLLRESYQESHVMLTTLMRLTIQDIEATVQRSYKLLILCKHIALIGLLIGVIAGPLISIWMARALSRPIIALIDSTQKIGQGDFYSKVKIERDDEIGKIAQSLDNMRSHLLKVYDKLLHEKTKIERANRAKDIFLANASHELRTPLTAIVGYAQLIRDGDWSTTNIQRIIDESSTLMDLINSVLDLTRIQIGTYSLQTSTFDLRQMIEKIRARYHTQISRKNLTFITDIPDTIPLCRSDQVAISQILNNFISNAIKFTKEGSIILKVSFIDRDDTKALVKFSVKDTGIGIPQDKHEYIFEEFTQISEGHTRDFGGMGLGLNIVHRLSRILNGRVGVNSEKGKGSEFWCEIPIDFDTTKGSAQSTDRELDMNIILDTSINILLAEDSDATREVLAIHLSKAGFTISTATHGQEAIDLCKNQQFDLILMDVQMPSVDGLTATRSIRAIDAQYSQIPIIGLTAWADAKTKQECLASGMDDVLIKPIWPHTIIQYIYRLHPQQNVDDIQALVKKDVLETEECDADAVNYTQLLGAFAGDKATAIRAIQRFSASLPGHLQAMKTAFDTNDIETFRKQVHKLYGGSSTLAMNRLSRIANELEKAARDYANERIISLMESFEKSILQIQTWIQKNT